MLHQEYITDDVCMRLYTSPPLVHRNPPRAGKKTAAAGVYGCVPFVGLSRNPSMLTKTYLFIIPICMNNIVSYLLRYPVITAAQ